MARALKDVAQELKCRYLGDGEVQLSGVASITRAAPGDVVFAENRRALAASLTSLAAAVIAGEFALESTCAKPIIISAHPKLTFARVAKILSGNAEARSAAVDQSSVIDPSARLDSTATIGALAVIGARVEIGAGTSIGPGCVIAESVKIGRDCKIYPNVSIYAGSRLGDRVIVHAGAVLGSDGFGYVHDNAAGSYEKFPQIGSLEIEDDVEIGANSTVDRGALESTRIGRGTKIDNLVHIGHNCQVGEDVIIAAQTGLSGSISIEDQVVLGGQVGIGEHARIEEGVMLGGQGGVLPNKILRGKGVAFWGTPARPVREYLKQLAVLERLAKKK